MIVLGDADEKTLEQMRQYAQKAKYSALMADNHFGYIAPVGSVAAFDEAVSVAGVGFDIACGNCAIRTNISVEEWSAPHMNPGIVESELADYIQNTVSFGIGRKNNADDAPVDHPLFEDDRWLLIQDIHRESLRRKAREQLGTVGSGNHYVDVFAGSDGWVWVGVHFGSRGLGHTIASGFLALSAGEQWGARVPEHDALLSLKTGMGRDYWNLMELCGEYAYAGREWVTRKVVQTLGGKETFMVHNHHNFAWRETHFGENLIVVRKGATPAWPDQYGFVGGSMGDDAVILRGADPDDYPKTGDILDVPVIASEVQIEQMSALYSTVHGAGRVMSRTQAAGKRNRKTGEQKTEGLVKQSEMDEWLQKKGVILRGGGLDESPQAYRRLSDVLKAQGPTVQVLTTLKPLIVVMAGADVHDPYKD